jgi:hypothetical protein
MALRNRQLVRDGFTLVGYLNSVTSDQRSGSREAMSSKSRRVLSNEQQPPASNCRHCSRLKFTM